MYRVGRMQVFMNDPGVDGAGGSGSSSVADGAGADGGKESRTPAEQKAWQEAERAFKLRDTFDKRAKEAEARAAAAENALKAHQKEIEEKQHKEAGNYDTLRANLLKETDEKVAAAQAERDAIANEIKDSKIEAAFSAASEWFGASGKTIYKPGHAQKIFGEFVDVELVEAQGAKRRMVVVRGLDGAPMLDSRTGLPESFPVAIGKLIDSMPDKNEFLRHSGKTGSGSSGGTTQGTHSVDLGNLKSADFKDPKVREALRQRQAAAGGLQIGPAWDRAAK